MKKPIVFTDFHHASLLNSLIMLFEGRLGGEVYRPIGIEWAERGFWKVYDHPFTREQFLSTTLGVVEPPPQMYPDGTRPLNIVDKIIDGVYYCQDIDSGYYNKAITIDKFLELPFDIVIASIPQHIEPFKKLCELHPNKPKLIYQIGNAWPPEAGLAPNVMASAIIHNVPEGVNFISYHQEFSLDTFYPQFPVIDEGQMPDQNIYSFINCFNIEKFYERDWGLFLMIESLMPEWNFKTYGGQCRDGAAHGTEQLADKMREARFVWHTKAGGDGYGHIIHNAPAVARPLIVKKQYYQGKLAEPLLVDGVSCIEIDQMPPEHIVRKIEHYSQPELYAKLSRGAYEIFKKVVNFDVEAKELEKFLENLV